VVCCVLSNTGGLGLLDKWVSTNLVLMYTSDVEFSFTAIPTIQDAISPHTGLLDGVFWVPQVIGGTGFVISA
jgi:hypothetical protein